MDKFVTRTKVLQRAATASPVADLLPPKLSASNFMVPESSDNSKKNVFSVDMAAECFTSTDDSDSTPTDMMEIDERSQLNDSQVDGSIESVSPVVIASCFDEDGSKIIEKTCNKKPKPKIRKFCDSWKQKFEWVVERADKPFCKLCLKVIHGNHKHLQRHEGTDLHKRRTAALKSQPKVVSTEKKAEFTKRHTLLKIAELRIVLFLMQYNLPFILVDHIIRLIKVVASDSALAKDLKLGKGKATYTTADVLCNEGLEQISDELRKNKFSLIIDETTDVSTNKCLAVVVRYFDQASCKVRDRFLTLIELSNFDAKSMFQNLKEFLNKINVPLANVIGIASDNASVMMGQKGGVRAFFEKENPNLYVMGCICHSLHLCSSYACKKLPDNLENLIRDIYSYFAHSTKRLLELKELQEMCNVKPHKILRTSTTRWLALGNVINRILEQWEPLLAYFSVCQVEKNSDLGKKIYSDLNSVNHLYLAFMSYILNVTNKINVEFQSEKPKVHILLPTIKSYYKNILSNFIQRRFLTDDTCFTVDFVTDAKILQRFSKVDDIYLGPAAFEMLDSSISESDAREVKQTCRSYYIELCKQICTRICFADTTLVAIQALNPSKLGESLMPLIRLFPNIVPECGAGQLECEWRELLSQDVQQGDSHSRLEEFWSTMFALENGVDEIMFPNICKFVGPLLALPHSSATAERIFSQLNLIKNKQRNKLLTSTVNAVMTAKELLGKCNFDEFKPSDQLLAKYHKY